MNDIPQLDKETILKNIINGISYREMLNIKDEKMKAWMEEAEDLIEDDKHDEATDLLTVLTSIDPYSKKPWHLSARLSMRKGKLDEASLSISFAMCISPKDPILHIEAAKIFYKNKDHKTATEETEIARSILDNFTEEQKDMLHSDYKVSPDQVRHMLDSIMH
ncbi:MAG: hypothetical protein KAH32_01650 [Chlamydiia bacterium]|nr:hypothetical protein [Chlamydiia bacterium]